VPPRLSATERIRAQIDELFASEQDLGQVLEQVARLSVRLVMQAALEVEVSEFLGRDRYARGERERAGYRNGHAELTVKTTAGPVVLERPKLRGTAQPFASRLLGKGVSRTNALEALVISGFVRGLSTRDVETPRATNSTSTNGSHSRRDVITERPGEDAEPSPKPRRDLDPQVLTIAPSAPVTTQGGGGGSGCHRRRVVSAGGSPRLSAFPPEAGRHRPSLRDDSALLGSSGPVRGLGTRCLVWCSTNKGDPSTRSLTDRTRTAPLGA